MGTKILPSQHCYLQHRFRSQCLTTSPKNPHPRRRRNPSSITVKPNQHDRDQSRVCDPSPAAKLVMGQVKILKRGEKLSSDSSCPAVVASNENREAAAQGEEGLNLVLKSTDRFGRNPEMVQNKVLVDPKVEIFAGCVIDASPSPSLVPVPRFLGKKLRPPLI